MNFNLSSSSTPSVADSTFYLCFLEDIVQPALLLNIMETVKFMITPIVRKEISKSRNYRSIASSDGLLPLDSSFKMNEILQPFFGNRQLIKGEHEVIALAFHLSRTNNIRYLILDDMPAKRFVEKNLEGLSAVLTGTIGFIGSCCYQLSILDKEASLKLLHDIEKSTFRVKKDVLTTVENRVKASAI